MFRRLRWIVFGTAGLAAFAALTGCLSPTKKVAQRIPELRAEWRSNAIHQAKLPERVMDWPAAVAFMRENNLKLRRSRADITNAQENVRQVFKDLLPQITLHYGVSQTIGEASATSWDDVFFDVTGFFNIPGVIGLHTRYFAARLALMRAEALYELAEREQTIELYKLILDFQEHQETRAALEAERRFANAVLSVDDVTGQVLLRDNENRELSLVKQSDSLQQRAGDLFGDRRWRWTFATNGLPSIAYDAEPLPLLDTNRVAQLQIRMVAIEFVGSWARLLGIKLEYWPDVRLAVIAPPIYSRRGGSEVFFDSDEIRLTAEAFWRLDTRGQISRQLRQARRDQELYIARIRLESIALIDRILAAQRLLADLRKEIAELNQIIPVIESVPPAPDFANIVKAAETRRSLRDQERRLRREVADLNTLFWFVDEQKWHHRENPVF